MRVGLVLGAGGVMGASWLMGALDALEAETGWRVRDAERIVGTSAGSVVGLFAAQGVEPGYMAAYAAGETLDAYADAELRAGLLSGRGPGTGIRLHPGLPSLGPGSWRLAVDTLVHPFRHAPTTALAAWLPRGFISTAPIRALVSSFVSGSWPEHEGYRAVAADYGTGRRVVFGRPDAPPADIRDAVAASCAIPGFYHPVRVGGRSYVDGGICSTSNLDLMCGEGLDLVICLNPMSSVAPFAAGSPADRFAAAMRAAAGRRLGREARALRAEGTRVLLLQPNAEDLELMGFNLLSGRRRLEVSERARRSVARELRGNRRRPELRPRPAVRSRARRAAA
jgi:NTE family protein